MADTVEERLKMVRDELARRSGETPESATPAPHAPRISVFEPEPLFLEEEVDVPEEIPAPIQEALGGPEPVPVWQGQMSGQNSHEPPQPGLWKALFTPKRTACAGAAVAIIGFAAYSISGSTYDSGKKQSVPSVAQPALAPPVAAQPAMANRSPQARQTAARPTALPPAAMVQPGTNKVADGRESASSAKATREKTTATTDKEPPRRKRHHPVVNQAGIQAKKAAGTGRGGKSEKGADPVPLGDQPAASSQRAAAADPATEAIIAGLKRAKEL